MADKGRHSERKFSFLSYRPMLDYSSFTCFSLFPEVKIDFRVVLPLFNFYNSSLLSLRTTSKLFFLLYRFFLESMASTSALASRMS